MILCRQYDTTTPPLAPHWWFSENCSAGAHLLLIEVGTLYIKRTWREGQYIKRNSSDAHWSTNHEGKRTHFFIRPLILHSCHEIMDFHQIFPLPKVKILLGVSKIQIQISKFKFKSYLFYQVWNIYIFTLLKYVIFKSQLI
jgi:hypothetical protein